MQSVSQPSRPAQTERFIGTSRVHPKVNGKDPSRGARTTITVEAGAQFTWLAHPLGRTLIVIDGCGHIERQDGAGEQIRPGDALWFAPGEKHRLVGEPTGRMTLVVVEKPQDWR
jgi:quercetin dioxygenase-like cupin family protein